MNVKVDTYGPNVVYHLIVLAIGCATMGWGALLFAFFFSVNLVEIKTPEKTR